MHYLDAEVAPIGYKIMKGDWIVMELPDGSCKHFKVTKTTGTKAIVDLKCRVAKKFPRYYSIPFMPLQRKNKEYDSPNKWYVKMNDVYTKNLRLKTDV